MRKIELINNNIKDQILAFFSPFLCKILVAIHNTQTTIVFTYHATIPLDPR